MVDGGNHNPQFVEPKAAGPTAGNCLDGQSLQIITFPRRTIKAIKRQHRSRSLTTDSLTAHNHIFSPPLLPQLTHKPRVSSTAGAKCNKSLPCFRLFSHLPNLASVILSTI